MFLEHKIIFTVSESDCANREDKGGIGPATTSGGSIGPTSATRQEASSERLRQLATATGTELQPLATATFGTEGSAAK